MTTAEQQLREYVEFLHKVATLNMQIADVPKGWVYQGPADLLLREGEFFHNPEAIAWPQSEFKACFKNAASYAILNGLRYIEGYSARMIAVHHGWCADDDDNVIEVTWKEPGVAYFGVEFDPWKVKRGSVLWNERNHSIYRKLIKKEHGK